MSPLSLQQYYSGTANLQSPAISVPVRNEAFQKAVLEYIDKLSEDDQEAFQSATDVMEKLEQLPQGGFRISTSYTDRMVKVQKVLGCVKKFLGSIAISIQHHPDVSSIVLGGLHYVLTVSTCPINILIFVEY